MSFVVCMWEGVLVFGETDRGASVNDKYPAIGFDLFD